MKIVLTGGHLSPLLSVLEEIKTSDKSEVLIVGRKHAMEGDKALSLESQAVSNLGFNFKSITTGRFQRKWTRYTLYSLLKSPYGFFQSLSIVRSFKPDVILCFGGYISIPVALAGFVLRIPVVLHEQTQKAGAANQFISHFAKKVLISWESSRKYFPKNKIILVGNPIRKEIVNNENKFSGFAQNSLPSICIIGGSLGSHAINLLIEGSIKDLLQNFVVFHQTGDAQKFKDYDRLQDIRNSLDYDIQKRYFLTKFINPFEMGSILRSADIVISRSGMNTITELLYLGKPSILIPLPYSQSHEQLENARMLEDLGLGKVLDQNKTNSNDLYEEILAMSKKINIYKENGKKAKQLVKTNAAKDILNILKDEIYEKKLQ